MLNFNLSELQIKSSQRYEIVRREIYPHLNIAEEILPGISYEKGLKKDNIVPSIRRSSKKKMTSLQDVIEYLRDNKENWNAVLVGDGGMGKTTSLLKLWEHYLLNKKSVPIFLRLEAYNRIIIEKRRDFVWHLLFKEYYNYNPAEEDIQEIKKIFSERTDGKKYPSIIFILDGFNEVTADTKEFLLCLNDLKNLKDNQIIISSRQDMRNNINWPDFTLLTLEPLDDKQIKNFMNSYKIEFDMILPDVLPLLRNPMILTLYCGMERELNKHIENEEYDFIFEPRYKGEILHNFMVSTLCRLDSMRVLPEEWALHRLYLMHLLPAIGYEMEKAGFFEISHKELVNIIEKELGRYSKKAFRINYPSIDCEITGEFISSYLNIDNYQIVIDTIKSLIEKYSFLYKSKNYYIFLHQDFRDYFAALYIKTRTEERIDGGEKTLPELSFPMFKYHLRSMLGEIAEEHNRGPVVTESEYLNGVIDETVFDRALNLLRYKEMKENDYSIINILEILKEKRVDLSDTDLSCLDLRRIVFNNIRLGYGKIKGKNIGVKLSGSRLKGSNFFPQGHSDSITSVIYSSDGSRILSGSWDNTIKEWDTETGECIKTYKGHTDGVNSVSYDTDCHRIVSGSRDNTIKEWDVNTGECIKTYTGHSDFVASVRYSSDGKRIVSGSWDNTIKEWNTETDECIRTYRGHSPGAYSKCVSSVSYSIDNKRIISEGMDKTIKEWNVETGDCIRTYINHCPLINSLSYSSGGEIIFIESSDGTIKKRDAETGDYIRIYKGQSLVNSANYSSDIERIVLGGIDGKIKEWDTETGKCIKTYEDHYSMVNSVSYSSDGKKIVSGSRDGTIKEWNTETGDCIRDYEEYSDSITCLNYSSNGKRIVSGSKDGAIKEWDRKTGKCIRAYEGHFYEGYYKAIRSVSYSNDCKRIISTSHYKDINEWNVGTGGRIRYYRGHSNKVSSVIYSNNGKKILSCSEDGTIKEWNVKTGKCIRTYVGHFIKVNSAIYSNNDRRILSGDADGIIMEWDVKTGNEIRTYSGHSNGVISLSYSSDGRRILSAGLDETIKEWDMETGECIGTYYNDGVTYVCYSSDGKKIISGSYDKTIKVWDRETGEYIRNYPGISDDEYRKDGFSISYSSDGNMLLTGSSDGTIKEWDIETGDCIRTIQNIHGLFIQGVDMTELHPDSEITESEKKFLKQYGAILEGSPQVSKRDIVIM